MTTVTLDGHLTLSDVINVARFKYPVKISKKLQSKTLDSANFIQNILNKGDKVYGLTTGLGSLCDTLVSAQDAHKMQVNIIHSHACGVGKPFESEIVRAIILLQINKLAKGYSGVCPATLDILIRLLNNNILPVVYDQGSVGSSGDLAPLAHIALVILGEGEATWKNKIVSGRKALSLIKKKPVKLIPREALALINGTEVLTAIAVLNIYDAQTIMQTADIGAALSISALTGNITAFDARIHLLKPHPGQLAVASNLRKLLIKGNCANSTIQDAYSLRCIPQVHGASRDAISYAKKHVEIELNSVTDNPLIFTKSQEILSGGNFHGQSIGIPMDLLAIALSEFANISERRIERLVNKNLSCGLPPFLAKNPGLNSGFMIPQYVAAALVSENKILSHPASVDSIPTSAGQEDHVSMATIASRKCRKIVENVQQVLAIELITSAQALDLRKTYTITPSLKKVYNFIRQHVPITENDIILHPYMAKMKELIGNRKIITSLDARIL